MKQVINAVQPLILLAILLSVTLFSSCKKYLGEKSNKALVVPVTIKDFQGLLDDASLMNLATPSFPESSADDYFLLETIYNSRPLRQQHVYTWTPDDDYAFENDWSLCYKTVYNTNLCLEGIQKITPNSTNELQWRNVRGAALFYRAYSYLNLAWTYAKAYDETSASADLGIVLRKSSDFNIVSTRSSIRDTYLSIINDAKEATQYLPDNPEHPMRPSKSAGYALLARVYLSMQKYDSAFKYSDLCLSIKNSLLNFNSVPVSNAVPFSPFNSEIIFYTEMNTNLTLHGSSRGKIDSSLYASYGPNDLRKKAFFTPNSGYQQFKGSYAADAILLFSGIATDEMYLIRAECNARLNKKDAALVDLNMLLEKRWATGTFTQLIAASSTEALDIILKERRKELLMRGLRWADIKRLNKGGANITPKRIIAGQEYLLPPNDKRYALPLPRDLIQNSFIQQN